MNIAEARGIAETSGWSQRLGFSKRALGVKTPKRSDEKRSMIETALSLRGILHLFKGVQMTAKKRVILRRKRKN